MFTRIGAVTRRRKISRIDLSLFSASIGGDHPLPFGEGAGERGIKYGVEIAGIRAPRIGGKPWATAPRGNSEEGRPQLNAPADKKGVSQRDTTALPEGGGARRTRPKGEGGGRNGDERSPPRWGRRERQPDKGGQDADVGREQPTMPDVRSKYDERWLQ